MADVSLRLPFNGDFPITFGFGAVPDSEDLKTKYKEWGLQGHDGLDYGLPVGTEVIAAAKGKVVQSGDNGDFGISVTLEHPWGQSVYRHLSETKVQVGDEPNAGDTIGLSGESGNVTGSHLHFGIKPLNPDDNNGYLGYIDPSPYFGKPEEKQPEPSPQPQETKPVEQPKAEEPKPQEEKPQPQVIEKEVIKEVIKEVPVVNQEEVKKQVDEKLKEKLLENKKKADEKRAENKKENLKQILDFVQEKKEINNQDVRDLLQVSQSTASYYLSELVEKGSLKTKMKGKATVYSA